jgi:hypothetical protein
MIHLDADSPRGTLLGWLSYTVDLATEFSRAGPDADNRAELEQRLSWGAENLARALANVVEEPLRGQTSKRGTA